MTFLEDALNAAINAEPELTARERDAIDRALLNIREARFVIAPVDLAVLTRDAGARDDLPCPRLQLRWADESTCHYELVLPLSKNDIRREHDGSLRSQFMAVPLGCTRINGGHNDREPMLKNRETGKLEVQRPYRDGAHIAWDAHKLGLPAFALWKDFATQIEPHAPMSET